MRCLFSSTRLVMFVLMASLSAEAANGPTTMPSMAKVQEHTLRFLSGLEDYQPGDMLARSQIDPLFAILYQIGWKVSDKKKILGALPADQDFLFQQFQTPQGQRFMRKISKDPANFYCLDRFSKAKGGRQQVIAIIQSPDAAETPEARIAPMRASQASGKETDQRHRKAEAVANSLKPTPKIYSGSQLIERLAEAHARDLARAQGGESK